MVLCSNVHVHSTWCDGKDTTDKMAEAAIDLGFTDLGFSSHAPAVFDPICPGVSSEEAYRADIARVKAKYADKICILCGIEADSHVLIDASQYDYVIGSNHYLPAHDGVYTPIDYTLEALQEAAERYYSGSVQRMLQDYFDLLLQGLKRQKPTILGHFDLVKKFNRRGELFDENARWYQQMALEYFDEVLAFLAEYGGIVEVNTGAMTRGLRDEPYPSDFLLRHAAQKNARIMITGDSHAYQALNGFYDEALAFVQRSGAKYITMLSGGEFKDFRLQ